MNHQKRINAITNALTKIHTPNVLTQVITNELIKYYGFTNIINIPHNNEHIKSFLQTQTKIGWNHFIRGRIAHNINKIVKHQYNEKLPTPHFDISQWKKKLCTIIIQQHVNTWKEYCTPTQMDYHTRNIYKEKIKKLQDKSTQTPLPHIKAKFFNITGEDINHMSKNQLDKWIHHAQIILQSIKNTTQPNITLFFKKTNKNRPTELLLNQSHNTLSRPATVNNKRKNINEESKKIDSKKRQKKLFFHIHHKHH